jgi:prepilin-type processing-associated H-X9-DG protein
MYLEETPWSWNPTNDVPRWHGCYSYAFRTRNRTTGLIEKPSNGSWGTGAWPGLRLSDGNYAYAFDHCTSLSTLVGRKTCHAVGYNCVFYDGHVELISGKMAETVDYIATFAFTGYEANFFSCQNVFDLTQGIFY